MDKPREIHQEEDDNLRLAETKEIEIQDFFINPGMSILCLAYNKEVYGWLRNKGILASGLIYSSR